MTLQLRNPHSVLAALEVRPQDVLSVTIPAQLAENDAWARVARMAKEKGVRVQSGTPRPAQGPRDRDDFRNKGRPQNQKAQEGGRQGVAEAEVKDRTPLPVEELFRNAPQKAGGKGLWIALDSLQDPHNVGAIFRAAAFFGVQGVLLTQERSAPLTGTVYDVASGGLEYVPFTVQVNLQRGFEAAKEAGLWILGTSEHAQDSVFTVQRDRPWLLVLGNEEKGMRRLTEEACDVLCKIPPSGKVTSLNVSVAAGIFISRLALPF